MSKKITVLLIAILAFGMLSGPVSANEPADIDGDFLCDNQDETFVQQISFVVSVIMFGAPVLGTFVWGAARVASIGGYGNDRDGIDGKSALITGWMVPVGLYALQLFLDLAFNVDVSCITPGGG